MLPLIFKSDFSLLLQTFIARHKYTDLIVSLSVEIYVHSRCGLRATIHLISYLNSRFQWHLTSIPSAKSIKKWVEKSGYSIYTEPNVKSSSVDYATIIDESMMIGSEKMLLTLGIASEKAQDSSLRVNDVRVLDISVKPSWDSQQTKEVFESIENKMGSAPCYVVSDNASTFSKAIKEKGYIHMRDVSHTLALFMEPHIRTINHFNTLQKMWQM